MNFKNILKSKQKYSKNRQTRHKKIHKVGQNKVTQNKQNVL